MTENTTFILYTTH